jgi:hypothetical protein
MAPMSDLLLDGTLGGHVFSADARQASSVKRIGLSRTRASSYFPASKNNFVQGLFSDLSTTIISLEILGKR